MKIENTRLFRNIGAMGVWQLLNYALPLLTFPYLTRVLGPGHFGKVGLTFACAGYLVVVAEWGFNATATHRVVEAKRAGLSIHELYWNVTASRCFLGFLTTAIVTVAFELIPALRGNERLLFAASLIVAGNAITAQWCLQGLELMVPYAVAASAGKIVAVILTFILVRGPEDDWVAVGVVGASAILSGTISQIFFWSRERIVWVRPRVAVALKLLKESWPIFVSNASHAFYSNSSAVVLGLISGTASVGIYSSADRIRSAIQGLSAPINLSLFPRVSLMMIESPDKALAFVRRVLILQIIATSTISVVIVALAPWIVRILMGPGFTKAVAPLQILSVVPVIVSIGSVLMQQVLVPMGHRRDIGRAVFGAAVIDLASTAILSQLFGVIGACWASLFTECAIMILLLGIIMKRKIPLFPIPLRSGRDA